MKKWIVILSLTLIFLSILFSYQYFNYNDGKLHVTFCNVGQGDAILIKTPSGKHILIDGGPDKSILNCLSNHLPFWERKIDEIILTHPHSDHYFGMYYVIDRYITLTIDTEDVGNNSVEYKSLVTKIKEKNIKQRYLMAGDSLKLNDGIIIKVAGPTKEYIKRNIPNGIIGMSKEQASLILHLSYLDFDLLLTGDSVADGIKQALPYIDGKLEIMQIPHHGSKSGLDLSVLKMINPDIGVISVGKNKYGHPSKEILQLLKTEAVKVLRTDEVGDVEIVSNGEGYMMQNDID